jgi:hypothetical protein
LRANLIVTCSIFLFFSKENIDLDDERARLTSRLPLETTTVPRDSNTVKSASEEPRHVDLIKPVPFPSQIPSRKAQIPSHLFTIKSSLLALKI